MRDQIVLATPVADRDKMPPGWRFFPAKAICLKIQDGTHFSPRKQMSSGPFMYVTAKNVRPSGLDLRDVTFLAEDEHRPIYTRCDTRFGDVLLVKDGVNVGDAAINTVHDEISLLSSVCFLRPSHAVSPHFLRYYLQSPRAVRALTGSLSGTAIRRIILQRVRELPVVVAPLAEQFRIVDAIETQLTRLDAAVASLKRVRASLKRARASVLKAAVEGRLVPTEAELARREGRSYEHASVLLERILEERRRRHDEGQVGAERKKKYQPPAEPRVAELGKLSEGWALATLDQLLFKLEGGNSATATDTKQDRTVLRSSAVRQGSVNFADHRFLPPNAPRRPEAYLAPGDLLFTRLSGTVEFVGNCAAVPSPCPPDLEFPDRVFRGRCLDLVAPNYVQHALADLEVRKPLKEAAKSSAGHQRIGLHDLRRLQLPLPPNPEQVRVVAEVERRLSIFDAIGQIVEINLRRCERLRQSILKRAFEGKLVPQDPNDEPASELLARIQAGL